MNKPSFLSELKRRQIYRGGVMYVVAGWVIVQVATGVFPYFDIPTWAIRFVVVAIMLGFPVSLVCLWMFESHDPEEPEKHLQDRRQARDDNAALAKLMASERAERQKETQELIAALSQLKTESTDTAGTPTMQMANSASPAPAMKASVPEPIDTAPAVKPRRKRTLAFALLALTLAVAAVWVLAFSSKSSVDAGEMGATLAHEYVAPGFSQAEHYGVLLLKPVLNKLGIGIAPERVFTFLLVIIGFLILRDLYRQFIGSRLRRAREH